MRKVMKILYVLGEVAFPLKTGPLLQSAYLIKGMSESHTCDVLGFTECDPEDQARKFRSFCPRLRNLALFPRNKGLLSVWKRTGFLLCMQPPVFGRFSRKDFREKLRSDLSENAYDLVHYYWFPAVAQYSRMASLIPAVMTLYDPYSRLSEEAALDSEHVLASLRARGAALLYRRMEKRLLPNMRKVLVHSHSDAEYLEQALGLKNTSVIPVHALLEDKEGGGISPESDRRSVLLLRPYGKGLRWFFERVFPELRIRCPGIRCRVLAQHIPAWFEKSVQGREEIEVVKWVDDLHAEFRRHACVIAVDLHGAGMANRVVSAMSVGMPVVGTSKAFRGIEIEPGVHCLVCDGESEMADSVVSLLGDRSKAQQIGADARELVRRKYSYQVVMDQTQRCYDDLFDAR